MLRYDAHFRAVNQAYHSRSLQNYPAAGLIAYHKQTHRPRRRRAVREEPVLHQRDPGPNCPEIIRMIVEIPKGSNNKYEYDTKLGVFRLDRTLYSPMHYPGDYWFVPGTIAHDGDPMDVLVLADEPTFTGCMMEVRPVGVLNMVDEKGHDEKILAFPERDPRYDQIHAIDQIFPHVRLELEHFFSIYKELEGKETIPRVGTRSWRLARILEARRGYLERQ